MKKHNAALGISAAAMMAVFGTGSAWAVELSYVSGAVGTAIEHLKETMKPWEERTGNTVTIVPMPPSSSDQFAQYRLWLSANTSDIDLYQTDIVWAPQLSDHFVDLSEAAKDLIPSHFESVIQSQTVDGKLVALPLFTDAPALYYRTDLLEKYGKPVPQTWEELTQTAQEIQDAERAEGNSELWGYVWQGNAYEGLTCNALEWINSAGGGQIIEPDGTISINNENAVAALETALSWIGTISPPGVLAYQEEEARGVWQTGNAVFMRNWPYAFSLSNSDDSAVKGKFDVAPLPSGGDGPAATLGGWNVAVSKYSEHQEAAIDLALYLSSLEGQKSFSMKNGNLPTIPSLYDDADIAEEVPLIPRWKEVFEQAVPRPSAPTKGKYNEVSAMFWSAVHETLAGNGTAAENLELLELDLDDLKGSGW
ncbi:ABC transporter substrate-binding protein [Paracoccus aerodenitrificans]|uniref:ABC transporter substrate-binding protein n=1 Tax=Paracoccus aerodenitrificans TaxID=3017781 RepID=UPI0022EFFCD0|nr:ABC transporter substrate-binding protein [Paracoccus aerodenitrificans]WBU65469.1 ABC transporter substrate-binding protein [Paracoccus aerodenitrificans]